MAIKGFKDAIVPTRKVSNYRRAVIKYDKGSKRMFAILSNGDVLPVIEDYTKAKAYYATPDNDVYFDKVRQTYDEWHKTKNTRPDMDNNTLSLIKRFWATAYPGQKVQGTIKDKSFIIKH